MIIFARIASILFGVLLYSVLLWLIWEKLAMALFAGAVLSVFALFVSIVVSALFGEHLLSYLTRRRK
jgi:hypothetical protein